MFAVLLGPELEAETKTREAGSRWRNLDLRGKSPQRRRRGCWAGEGRSSVAVTQGLALAHRRLPPLAGSMLTFIACGQR